MPYPSTPEEWRAEVEQSIVGSRGDDGKFRRWSDLGMLQAKYGSEQRAIYEYQKRMLGAAAVKGESA